MPLKFINPHSADLRRGFFDLIRWKLGFFDEPNQDPIAPDSFTYPIPNLPFDPERPSVTWINHSTFLISINGLNFLTDPIWSKRCSPLFFVGPKRRHHPPIDLDQLPKIHYVLISHNHYDHLDKKTVLALNRRFSDTTWLVPHGVKAWFDKYGIDKVVEMDWWEQKELQSIVATAVPAQHFSGRTGRDFNLTLWVGWVIEVTGKRFYFVGDTGYNSYDFKEIGHRWKGMDLSLIPIGTYKPRLFMSPVHIEPRDAVRIHQEVRSHLSIGMHWKTFHLSEEPLNQPPYDLFLTLKKEGIDPSTTFLAPEPGHTLNW